MYGSPYQRQSTGNGCGIGCGIGCAVVAVIAALFLAMIVYIINEVEKEYDAEWGVTVGGEGVSEGDGASREDPMPIGSYVEGRGWKITLDSVNLDAEKEFAAENGPDDSPKSGKTFVLVHVTAEYIGDDPQGGDLMLDVQFVQANGRSLKSTELRSTIPEEFDKYGGKVYKGGTVSGNFGFEVMESEIDGAVISIAPSSITEARFFKVK